MFMNLVQDLKVISLVDQVIKSLNLTVYSKGKCRISDSKEFLSLTNLTL